MKILVRGTNWIGDAVMSIPALRELRRLFPDARITLHTRSWAEGLFTDASFIDELVTFDKHRWKVKDVIDNAQFLRPDGFDLAILLPNSFESALTSFLTKIPKRFGYNKDVRGLLLSDPIAVPEWKGRRHEVFYYLNLISQVEQRLLGTSTVSTAFPDISLDISDDRKRAAREQLIGFGVDTTKKLVALGIGSTNSMAKRWPAERYAQLNDRLQADAATQVILVGSSSESDVAERVANFSERKPIDLSGRTDLAEIAAILSVIDLLICNDMGLAHLAPAVGTRTLTIFGPTDPETTRPFSDLAAIVRKNVDCSPCMLRVCPIDHRCMTRITVNEVFEMAKGMIDGSAEIEDKEGEYIN